MMVTFTMSKGNNQVVFISKKAPVNIFINTIYFVLGFSLVFSVLGVILNSVLAISIGTDFQQYLSYIGGIISSIWS
ncbi:hypothetical protein YTPLAS21_19980 [Candidatus Nitrosocosmicus sp.]|nr:hypothetical protein YTPLAS21_19980 [Candidatus Nitrosocosmicus sp.]